ncbi:MAG: GNAT family N-acetyltransferase [Bacteroidales bacterium]|jgi:RimJ/RimL family protein N-acetyltransferase
MKYLLKGQESARLAFRSLVRDDFNTWMPFFEDRTAVGFLGLADIGNQTEQCEKWFEITENRYKNDLGGLNVLIDKVSDKFVGQCGLLIQEVDGIQELEIGYSILPEHRNKGYATEAAQKCRDYAFENNFTDSLISIVHVDNIRSEKVAKKNGMTFIKKTIFREIPVNIFRITRTDWLKK